MLVKSGAAKYNDAIARTAVIATRMPQVHMELVMDYARPVWWDVEYLVMMAHAMPSPAAEHRLSDEKMVRVTIVAATACVEFRYHFEHARYVDYERTAQESYAQMVENLEPEKLARVIARHMHAWPVGIVTLYMTHEEGAAASRVLAARLCEVYRRAMGIEV